MNAEHAQNNFATTQSLSAHLLNLPPPPRYETAGARSTRMIIDSASYTTTPSCSPPPEPSHVFSAYDTHRKVPDVASLTEAGHVLEQQMNQNKLGQHITSYPAHTELPALEISSDKEDTQSDRRPHHQGIIPPYMLQAIAASEAAGPQARASAEQTLLSSKPAKDNRAWKGDFSPIAPAQRQLKDGRWIIGF
jgi:hypothetical protein